MAKVVGENTALFETIEAAISGESDALSRLSTTTEAGKLLDSAAAKSYRANLEAGEFVMLAMARQNPFLEAAKRYDMRSVKDILEKAEYKELLADPDGVAFLICQMARDVEALARHDHAEQLAQIRDVAMGVIDELAQPLIQRRKTGRLGGSKSGESKRSQGVAEKVLSIYQELVAAGRPERERASIIAKRVGVSATQVRYIVRQNKTKDN
ncbi:hypothetical protein [Burkholderia seminalis]|uniref:hypothetical protein n=1 Tax=Burkholderia seminalis TaxID=488731 RepID=UPI002650DC23|nr:hypothetical protein [Burkholderia seminalis]MDN7592254.1 hypothetical protein [Burkholderia seminalis]